MSVTFSNFSFRHKAQRHATLKELNLTINKGEKILIIGASGSGKSTLGHCLNGLAPNVIQGEPGGTLPILGENALAQPLHQRTETVGTVLQDTDGQFVGLSVAEDIAFALENQVVPGPEMQETVHKTARMVDLEELLSLSPFDLSGGQKQRVSLAGILVDDVDILLFDEPLASLDPATGQRVIEIIDQLHAATGKTVLIIEHRLEDVLHRPVDRIILMDKGRIVADTTPAELLKSPLLAQHGIREPLYLRALKLVGCQPSAFDTPENFDSLELAPHRESLCQWLEGQAIAPQTKENETLLEVKGVSYSYDGERQILDDVSLELKTGEFLAVLGKNGSGKSTLSKLIMGAFDPDQGELIFRGEDLTRQTIFQRSESIGVVMQNPNHMVSQHMIFDEVALGLRSRGMAEDEVEERVTSTLALCGLKAYAHWPVDALSYGQKKRVTIAAVLVMQPALLILDEPTAGQDLHHYSMMMRFIRQLNEKHGISILIISHDMHLVLEYCKRAVVLADGRLLADECVYRLFSQPELLARANLTETSLYRLARDLHIEPAEEFIRSFISHDGADHGQG